MPIVETHSLLKLVPQALQVSDKKNLLHEMDLTTENEGQGSSSLRVVKVSYKVTYRVFIIKKGLKHVLSYPLQRIKKCIYIYI